MDAVEFLKIGIGAIRFGGKLQMMGVVYGGMDLLIHNEAMKKKMAICLIRSSRFS